MKISNLKDMKKGWFVGSFEPTVLKTQDVEVAIKSYLKGELEERHHHKIATEITVILSGEVKMNNTKYKAGDIVTIMPLEATDFEALTDVQTVVVKHPGATNDKYLGLNRVDFDTLL
ncbi:cupin domain-containing protein [Candidatus Thioglobus sp.]|nr:cupin domain-containing protein [Candidatus Thioglobus sp.]